MVPSGQAQGDCTADLVLPSCRATLFPLSLPGGQRGARGARDRGQTHNAHTRVKGQGQVATLCWF